jgi:hypothetical protein
MCRRQATTITPEPRMIMHLKPFKKLPMLWWQAIFAANMQEPIVKPFSPARSGTVGSPISYEPFGDGDVIIDGADPVMGWTLYSGSIYKATMNWDLGAMNQVFVGDAIGQLARWPNVSDVNNPFNLSNFAYPDAGSALNRIVDNDLPAKPDNYLKDAILWAELGLKWSSFGTRIILHLGICPKFAVAGYYLQLSSFSQGFIIQIKIS